LDVANTFYTTETISRKKAGKNLSKKHQIRNILENHIPKNGHHEKENDGDGGASAQIKFQVCVTTSIIATNIRIQLVK
jgi:hypothetical protein